MRKIRSIIAAILVGSMVLGFSPGAQSIAGAQNPTEQSMALTATSHPEHEEVCTQPHGDEEMHRQENECTNGHLPDCAHEPGLPHQHEREHENEHNHGTACEVESTSGHGVKIAIFDSGISDLDTAGGVSFVQDSEIISSHGNTVAAGIKKIVPAAKLYDVRILNNNNEGTYSSFAQGVDWAVKENIDIISLSCVGLEASAILEAALKKAEENNILVIAAAGNGASNEPAFPAAYPTVISVGALDGKSEIADYSNYGELVDIYAFASQEGTSYSTGQVTAAAAKYLEINPFISSRELRSLMTDGKEKNSIISDRAGNGILHAAATCAHTFNGSYTTTKNPTCTAAGTKVGKCTKCGATVSTVSIPALGHSYGSWTTTKSATCTSDGSKKRTCSRCSGTETQTISATGHTFSGSYTTTKEPTCTATGTKVGKCTKCGGTVSTVTLDALGHSFGSWTTTVAATCTANGTQKRTCTRSGCTASESKSIAATGHTFNGSYTTTKEPTCTATGTKVGKCTKCGGTVSTVTLDALGHSLGSWTTTVAATCTANGTQKRTCTRSGCTFSESKSIAATGHTFNGSYTTTKEPTCTATGTKVGKCTKCGGTVSTVTLDALGHSYGSWSTTVSPTCTSEGTQRRSCTRSGCYSGESTSVSATGHTFNGSYTTTKEPTCADAGTKVGRCTTCNAVVSTVSIPPLATAHSFNGSYTTTREATCTTTGTKVGKCINCGTTVSTVTIPVLGHAYGPWTTTRAAACTTEGSQKRSCTRSGCTFTETDSIAATGHTFNGSYTTTKEPTCTEEGTKVGRCTTCNAVVSTVSIPPLATAHTFNGVYITTKEPTCTQTGTKVGKCTRCGETVSTVTLDKLGHFFGPWETTRAATCMTLGIQERRCTREGCLVPESKILPEVDHTFNGNYIVTKDATCTETGVQEARCAICEKVLSTEVIPSGSTAEKGHDYVYVLTVAPTATRNGIETGKCKVCQKVHTRLVNKVSEQNYTYDLLPADSQSPYGYVNFNGVRYPISVDQAFTGIPAIDKARTVIAEINRDKTHFNWTSFIGGFSLTDDYNDFHDAGAYVSGGFVLFTDVLRQLADSLETSYYSIIISEATDGTDYRAIIRVGSSTYEDKVESMGTGKDISLYQLIKAAGGTTYFFTDNAEKLYEYVTGEEGDILTLYDVVISLDPHREGGKYTENLYVNSSGQIVRHLIPFTNDKMYLAKVTAVGFSYEKLMDVSYLVNPLDSRFVGPLIK